MSRLIDRLAEPTTIIDNKIIVLSRSRVGTFSMYQSFQILGYKPYHMYECVQNGASHMMLMDEALRCKYLGQGKQYDKSDFDKWLANYDVIVELPQFFIEEFIEFYPNAKFILAERGVESWQISLKTVSSSVLTTIAGFPFNILKYIDSDAAAFVHLNLTFFKVCFHGLEINEGSKLAAEDMLEGSALAKRLLPPKQLLVAKLEDGFGWEQICPFLGVDIPEQKYPRGNAPAEFDKLVGGFVRYWMLVAGAKLLGAVAVPLTAVSWYYYARDK